jgi:hypothetical protein
MGGSLFIAIKFFKRKVRNGCARNAMADDLYYFVTLNQEYGILRSAGACGIFLLPVLPIFRPSGPFQGQKSPSGAQILVEDS